MPTSSGVTLSAYDEVAHHSGIVDRDSLRVSKLDCSFARAERAAQSADRPYQFVILSDHGQTQGATFKQRYGVTPASRQSRSCRCDLKIHARLQPTKSGGMWPPLSAKRRRTPMLGRSCAPLPLSAH